MHLFRKFITSPVRLHALEPDETLYERIYWLVLLVKELKKERKSLRYELRTMKDQLEVAVAERDGLLNELRELDTGELGHGEDVAELRAALVLSQARWMLAQRGQELLREERDLWMTRAEERGYMDERKVA